MIFLSHLFSPSPRSWRGEGGVRGYFSIGSRGESPSPGSHLRCDPASPRKRGEARKKLNRALQHFGEIGLLPGEAALIVGRAAEMTVGGGARINRLVEIEMLADAARRQI